MSQVAWLAEAARQPEADLVELGRAFYARLAGAPPPAVGPLPELPHQGLDQIVCRLLCPAPVDRYPTAASLLWDLDQERWNHPDFVAAAGQPRPRPAEPAVVGREAELAEVLTGPGQLTLVVGQAGLGKTRLFDQVERRALAGGFEVWRAECQEKSHQALQPFQDLVAELARQGERHGAFREALGERLASAVRLFPVLKVLGQPAAESEAEDFVATRNREACVRLFGALGRPALLLIDDLHWAEPEVLEILAELAGQPDLRVVAAARHHLSVAGRTVPLQPLPPSQLDRLARSMCGPIECEELTAWSQGYPLLAAALIRNLCDTGALVWQPQGWRRSKRAPAWGSLPPSVENLLGRRAESVSPPAYQVLTRAALLGRRFRSELLEDDNALSALQEGQSCGLLENLDQGLWTFTHDLIWRELQQATSPAQKLAFHARVADRLLSASPAPAGEVAHHLWEAGQTERCLPWAQRAAEEAQAKGALEPAARFWKLATSIEPQQSQHWFQLGEALRLAGRYPEAEHAYRQALECCADPLGLARTDARLGETAWRAGNLPGAAESFRRGLARLGYPVPARPARWLALLRELLPVARGRRPLTPAQQLAARMLDQLSYTVAYSDGVGLLIWANLRGLRLARSAAPGKELGILLASHALLALHVPSLLGRARRSVDEAVQLVARHGDAYELACTQGRKGAILLFTGQLEAALETAGGALARLLRSGDRYDVRMTRYNVAYILYWLGRLEEARQAAREGWRDASSAGDWLAAGFSARVLAALGEVPDDFYLHFERPHSQPHVENLRRELHGLLSLVRGRPDRAAEELEAASKLSRQHGISMDNAWQSCWLATAYRLQAEQAPLARRHQLYAQARRAATVACKWARAGYPIFLPHALRELAWAELAQGKSTDKFEKSLEAALSRKMELQARLTEIDRIRAGLAPRQHLSGPPFWQIPDWEETPQQLLAQRFDQVVEQSRDILTAPSPSEALSQSALAARVLLGAESCHVIPATTPLERPVVEKEPAQSGVRSSMVVPLGRRWGESLNLLCQHRQIPDRFGPEEQRLGGFLGMLAGAAYDNASTLEELSARERWLARLLEALPVGVATLDPNGRILQANAVLRDMLGEELENRLLSDYVYREDRASRASERRFLGRRGNLIWAEQRSTPLNHETSVVSLTDLSWRRLAQVAAFQENERRLLGMEVHDVSQPLVGLRFQLQALAVGVPQLDETCRLVDTLLDSVRSLIFDLRTPPEQHFHLDESLRELLAEVCNLSGLKARVEFSGLEEVRGLPALFAYRIVVEGLTNIRRHAGASQLRLRLRSRQGRLRGSLLDDGQGIRPQAQRRRFGLRGIRERAELLGGWARWRSRPDEGTWLCFSLPLDPPT